jgi:hypothetical protein
VKFSIKNYKFLKIKKSLKESAILFFYNVITPKDNIKVMQEFKKLDLKHYKLSNTMAKQTFKSSIYKNYAPLISSFVMLIFPNTTVKINKLKYFKNMVTFLGIKFNNKIYTFKNIYLETKFEFNNDYWNLVILSKFYLKPFINFQII